MAFAHTQMHPASLWKGTEQQSYVKGKLKPSTTRLLQAQVHLTTATHFTLLYQRKEQHFPVAAAEGLIEEAMSHPSADHVQPQWTHTPALWLTSGSAPFLWSS